MNIRSLALTQALAPLFVAGSLIVTGCSTTTSDVGATDKPVVAQGDHAAMPLPPGWSEADMQACMLAGQPGPMHKFLTDGAGTWKGKSTMWMAPDMPPTSCENTCTITSVMDGRYTKLDYFGEVPGMGPFQGLGYEGFDNVSQKFVATWIDSHSSGIMTGEGTLAADGKTLTWNYRYNDPITKAPATLRQVEHYTTPDAMTIEMFGKDPKSGREFKMMQIELKRQSSGKAGT